MIYRIKSFKGYKLVQIIWVELKLKKNFKKIKINLIFWSTVEKVSMHHALEWIV